jgi:hypothetical protein
MPRMVPRNAAQGHTAIAPRTPAAATRAVTRGGFVRPADRGGLADAGTLPFSAGGVRPCRRRAAGCAAGTECSFVVAMSRP